jgi:hypothetical protein
MKFTEEQIAAFKKEHGDIFLLEFPEVNKSAILKKPTRAQVGHSMSAGSDALKKAETLIHNCWVAGDEEIKTNAGLLIGAIPTLDKIIEVKSAELKKL